MISLDDVQIIIVCHLPMARNYSWSTFILVQRRRSIQQIADIRRQGAYQQKVVDIQFKLATTSFFMLIGYSLRLYGIKTTVLKWTVSLKVTAGSHYDQRLINFAWCQLRLVSVLEHQHCVASASIFRSKTCKRWHFFSVIRIVINSSSQLLDFLDQNFIVINRLHKIRNARHCGNCSANISTCKQNTFKSKYCLSVGNLRTICMN